MAWAALGPDCNDPQRLWTIFLAALERAGLDSPSLEGLRAPAEVDDAFLDRLLLALEEQDSPVVVVLEDLHEVTGARAVRSVDTLVRLLPDCVHLVMITRSDPPLSLHRLRVGGSLARSGTLTSPSPATRRWRCSASTASPSLTPRSSG